MPTAGHETTDATTQQTGAADAHANKPRVIEVTPNQLRAWLDADEALLIDVREPFEHNEERIPNAAIVPLASLDAQRLQAEHPNSRIVFHCASGKRSERAARQLAAIHRPAFHLAGGIDAWKAAGQPVLRPTHTNRLPIMRQVQIAAGSIVAIGTILGATAHPAFLAIPGFVGAGLVFAGLTGWCGMAKLLATAPWNKARDKHAP